MNFRSVQRSVRPQRFDRSAGDTPSLGRLARIPGTGLPQSQHQSQHQSQRRRRRRSENGGGGGGSIVMVRWSLAFGGVALGLLVMTMWLWLQSNRKRGAANDHERSTPQMEVKRVMSRFESPSEAEALNLVKRGIKIRESADVAEYFHLGSSSADEVSGFLREMAKSDGALEDIAWLSSVDANGLLIDGVLIKTRVGDKFKNRLALLTPDAKGQWKIEFEAFARRVTPSWDELLGKQVTEGLVRVIVALDRYYNGPFHDDSKWECYSMISPDTDVLMLGYCQTGSPQAKAMERIVLADDSLSISGSPKRVTLKIRRIEGGESRQFEITQVMAEDWVISEKPFDANFE